MSNQYTWDHAASSFTLCDIKDVPSVLLGREKNGSYKKGLLNFPGGGITPEDFLTNKHAKKNVSWMKKMYVASKKTSILEDEVSQTIAIRETIEETGIVVKPRALFSIHVKKREKNTALLQNRIWFCEYKRGTPLAENDEMDEVLWVPLAEVLVRKDVTLSVQCTIEDYFVGSWKKEYFFNSRIMPYTAKTAAQHDISYYKLQKK